MLVLQMGQGEEQVAQKGADRCSIEEADVESREGAQWGRELGAWLSAVVPEGFSKEVTFEKSPNGDARASHVTRQKEGALDRRLRGCRA